MLMDELEKDFIKNLETAIQWLKDGKAKLENYETMLDLKLIKIIKKGNSSELEKFQNEFEFHFKVVGL